MDYVFIYRIRDFKIKIMKKYNKNMFPHTMQTTRFARHIYWEKILCLIHICL